MGHSPITELSAAISIVRWTHEHGRSPRDKDCQISGSGLYRNSTYYRRFGVSTFSAVIDRAFDLTSGVDVFLNSPRLKTKKCLNYDVCGSIIADEGKHIRMCNGCKRRIELEYSDIDMTYCQPIMSRKTLEKYGVGRSEWFADLAKWGE